jgi:crotonobetainyl-CoA:carnitine CoA-transferase CaiB-like acyl-CoA transferase
MKPLKGIRVLSVEQFGAGPYGSMFLADLGADVIKIENARIGGDPARQTGPFMLGKDDSEYFQTWNMNKRSVTLDLKSDEGRAQFEHLATTADVLLNNLRGDLPDELGLTYEVLAKINPRLVCVHISAYGRDNERASWPGYDYLMQAETGLMSLTGEPSGPPSRFGAPSVIDHVTGLTATVGLLAALVSARTTGIGCDVDTCLFEVGMHQLGYAAIWYLNEGFVTQRLERSAHLSVAPVQNFPTADGWILVMAMTQKFWLVLIDVLGVPHLADVPEFASPSIRGKHRDQLTPLLDEVFRTRTTDEWLRRLEGKLPVSPVLDVGQALESDFVKRAGIISHVPHPARPDLRVLANPIRINGERMSQRVCSPIGADNGLLHENTVEQESK